ncbi:hypothetical protein B0H14DRAFT_2445933 [Mycena olivaceomarginata]|nr:hypothetical protein B0H14DRAFT_2445933 [Mycena olivaceomarginata]
MASATLPPVTQEILDRCPRLRVLVVGKSGVGKSSLISHAFGLDMKSVAHGERGNCNINDEIISAENSRFVLHDSMGFEPGQTKNFDDAKNFLEKRGLKDVALKDRVHVIWCVASMLTFHQEIEHNRLCIQAPHAGGRVFEKGDEALLKLASGMKVPVVVVFTQCDELFNSILFYQPENTPTETIDRLWAAKFQELCVRPLEKINSKLRYAHSSGLARKQISQSDRDALEDLIRITRELVEKGIEGEAWIVSAMAQRASNQVKIDGSIGVGMKRYWRGLASSTNFAGWSLQSCLTVIHRDITDSWNFHDPQDLLNTPEFSRKIETLVQLVTPDDMKATSLFGNLENIQTLVALGLGATLAAATGPAIVAVGLSVWFINWAAQMYQKTPETLRCLMGYIVDLTLFLDRLFLVVLARPFLPLTEKEIDLALENYRNSGLGIVHREIRQYVSDVGFLQILQANKAEEKVKELIRKHSKSPSVIAH